MQREALAYGCCDAQSVVTAQDLNIKHFAVIENTQVAGLPYARELIQTGQAIRRRFIWLVHQRAQDGQLQPKPVFLPIR